MEDKLNITITDRAIWHQIVITGENCEHCNSGDSVTIPKNKIKKLIKISLD